MRKGRGSCRKGAAMQKEKQKIEIIFINLGEKTNLTEQKNRDASENTL